MPEIGITKKDYHVLRRGGQADANWLAGSISDVGVQAYVSRPVNAPRFVSINLPYTSLADLLASSQIEYKRALTLYRQLRFHECGVILNKLLNNLTSVRDRDLKETERQALDLLKASIESAFGRLYATAGLFPKIENSHFRPNQGKAKKHFKAAVSQFGSALNLDLNSELSFRPGQEWRDYGVSLYHLGEQEAAEAAFRKATEFQDSSTETRCYLYIIRASDGRDGQDLESDLTTALSGFMDDPIAYRDLGEYLSSQKTVESGADAYYRCATALTAGNHLEAGLAILKLVLELAPGHVLGLTLRAEILRTTNQPILALQSLDKVAALEESAETLATRGAILHDLGRFDEALETLNLARSKPLHNLGYIATYQGLAHFALGQVNEAVDSLRLAAQHDPNAAQNCTILGELLLTRGEPKEAIKCLDEALRHDPRDTVALGLKGRALVEMDQASEAIKHFIEALDIDASLEWIHIALGEGYMGLRLCDKALESFSAVIERNPNHALAQARVGQALLELGHYKEAIFPLRLAARLSAKSGDRLVGVQFNLALVLFTLERYGGALRALKRLTPEEEHDVRILTLRGMISAAQGDHPGAIRQFEDALNALPELHQGSEGGKLRKDQGWLWLYKSRSYYKSNEFAAAADALERAHRFMEPTASTLMELAESYFLAGQIERCERTVEEILHLDESNPWALTWLGRQERQKNRNQAALGYLETALEASPPLLWTRREIGLVYVAKREYRSAMPHLDAVLREDPQDVEVLLGRGRAAFRTGDTHRARQLWLRAAELDSKMVEREYAWLAQIHMRDDEIDKAGALLERTLRDKPDNVWALAEMAKLLTQIGQYQDGVSLVDRALEIRPKELLLHYLKGHMLEMMGPDHSKRALKAYQQATPRSPQPAPLSQRSGVASALYMSREKENINLAINQYLAIGEELQPTLTVADIPRLLLYAWCLNRTSRGDEAVSHYVNLISHTEVQPEYRFDFALALLCTGDQAQALAEYSTGVTACGAITAGKTNGTASGKLASQKPRGLLHVALLDLMVERDVRGDDLPLEDFSECGLILSHALKEAWREDTIPAATESLLAWAEGVPKSKRVLSFQSQDSSNR